MASFTASVPLNMTYRHVPTGTVVEIVGNKQAGTPLAAGTPFTIPDAVADDFETDYGTEAVEVPPPRYWDNWWTPLPPTARPSRIPGLTRL